MHRIVILKIISIPNYFTFIKIVAAICAYLKVLNVAFKGEQVYSLIG